MEKVKESFKRQEKKYLLTEKQYQLLLPVLEHFMSKDEYPESEIHNIYYDTSDFRMIRTSLEKPTYKEKIRLRSYYIPQKQEIVFLELKKKFDGVVYKRRLAMTYEAAKELLPQRKCPSKTQIGQELQWALEFYQAEPKMYIGYHRLAYKGKQDEHLRLTIDSNLRFRTYHLELEKGGSGMTILEQGCRLMEIKAMGAMPLWLVKSLNALEILPISFSKYGTAYAMVLQEKEWQRKDAIVASNRQTSGKNMIEKGGGRCA